MLNPISTNSLSSKSLILFIFGCTLAVVLMTVQYEHKLLLFNSPRLMLTLPSLSLIAVCGLGAAIVGFIYPMLNTSNHQTSIERYPDDTMQKSQFCKCLVIFVGINHLCAKIPFSSDIQFSIIIVSLCIAFWWWFNGNSVDFIFSLITSIILTLTTEILLRAGALQHTNSNFYLKTCVPCLTFAGAILTIQITKLLSQEHSSFTSTTVPSEHLKTE